MTWNAWETYLGKPESWTQIVQALSIVGAVAYLLYVRFDKKQRQADTLVSFIPFLQSDDIYAARKYVYQKLEGRRFEKWWEIDVKADTIQEISDKETAILNAGLVCASYNVIAPLFYHDIIYKQGVLDLYGCSIRDTGRILKGFRESRNFNWKQLNQMLVDIEGGRISL
jgi:hypothetical protein